MTPDEIARFDALRDEYRRVGARMLEITRISTDRARRVDAGEHIETSRSTFLAEAGEMMSLVARSEFLRAQLLDMVVDPALKAEADDIIKRHAEHCDCTNDRHLH